MRRPTVMAAALAGSLLLAACGGTAPDPADPAAQSPAASAGDQVVVALDDFAALNVLNLGVTPDLVIEAFRYETTSAIFKDLGIATKPYGTELDLEQVIAADPDVIVGVSLPTTVEKQKDLESIASTTVLDYAGTWQQQLEATAAALGREDQAAALQARLEDDVKQLAADLEARGITGKSASVIGDNQGTFSPPADTALGSLLAGAGLARPAAQLTANTPPFVTFSTETLLDHDGDLLFLLGGGAYATDGLTRSPLWGQLGAVTSNAVHEVDGETWLGSSAFSLDWIIRDLRATLLDGGRPAKGSEAPTRFADFLAAA